MSIYEDIFGCHSWVRGRVLLIPRVEARGVAKYPIIDKVVPTAKNDPSQMLVVPRPRDPALNGGLCFCINSKFLL